MKNNFDRWLESIGQNPQTFLKDASFSILKGIILTILLTLPIAIATPLMRGVKLSGPPGTKLPVAVFAFVIGFFLYIGCILYLMNRYNGRAFRFTKIFPAPKNFNEGQVFRFQSGTIGSSSYNSALLVRVAKSGIFIKAQFPFSFLQRPILIPWSEIQAINDVRFLWAKTHFFIVGTPKIASFTLENRKLVAAARKMWEEQR